MNVSIISSILKRIAKEIFTFEMTEDEWKRYHKEHPGSKRWNHHIIPTPKKGKMNDEEWEKAKVDAKKQYFYDMKKSHPNYIPILDKKAFENTLFNGEYSCISVGLNPDELKQKMNEEEVGKLLQERMEQLKKDLDSLGVQYTEIVGSYGAEEPSFMISHSLRAKCENEDNAILVGRKRNRDDVIRELNRLGEKYNQESVAHVKNGQMEWHYTTGENKGKKGIGNPDGTKIIKAKDLFSEARLGDEEYTKWSCDMSNLFDEDWNLLPERLIDNPLR